MRCNRVHRVLAVLVPLVLAGGASAQTPPTPAVVVMPVEARDITVLDVRKLTSLYDTGLGEDLGGVT
jgi:hypothetical protein